MKPIALSMLLLALLGTLLPGCAAKGDRLSSGNECFGRICVGQSAEAGELLAYNQRIRSLSPEELNSEYAIATQALTRQKSDANRLRIVLLLTQPNASFRDDTRAAALIDEVLANRPAENSAMKALAQLLGAMVNERRRQEDRYQKLNQKLGDEEKRADALQQKLEALKTIEKNLINREQAPPLRVK
jgi:cellulose biosynthesis protein BcsQ